MLVSRKTGLLESAWKEECGGQAVGVALMLTGRDSPDSAGLGFNPTKLFEKSRKYIFQSDKKIAAHANTKRVFCNPLPPHPPLPSPPPPPLPELWDQWREGDGRADTPDPAWQGAHGPGPSADTARNDVMKDSWTCGHLSGRRLASHSLP